MNRLLVRVVVALVALTIGLVSARLWTAYRRPSPRPLNVEVGKVPEPTPAPQSITFKNTGAQDVFMVTYVSSDGVIVRYGCFERTSSSRALRELSRETIETRVVERTSKLNDKGEKIGKRVVSVYSPGSDTEAEINWTEGPKIFFITAPSLEYAFAFEKSQAWEGQYCPKLKLIH